MKKFSFVFFFLPLFSIAQDVKPPLLDLDGVQFSYQLNWLGFYNWNPDDFLDHAQEMIALDGSPNETFAKSGGGGQSKLFQVKMTFTPIDPKTAEANRRHELRIGTGYYTEQYFQGRNFYGTSTGDTDFINSYVGAIVLHKVSVNSDYLFKTNPERNVSLFTGAGAGVAVPFASEINVSHVIYYDFWVYDSLAQEYIHTGDSLVSSVSGYSNAKNSILINAYLPLGIEFHVLKKFRFSFEGNIGGAYQLYFKASDVLHLQYAAGLGLKYMW